MSSVGFVVAGIVGSLIGWRALRDVFSSPLLQRENYRGHHLAVATGVVAILAVTTVTGVLVVSAAIVDRPGPELLASCITAMVTTVGIGLLGFVDDVLGSGASRGFRGHLGALGRGTLTTGALKLIGTPLVALVALALTQPTEPAILLDAAVVAAAANLGNLFDRAPGRVIKVTSVATVAVAAAAPAVAIAGPMIVVGAGLGLLPVDLSEDGMLGDTGSNVLGAGLGLALVAALATTGTAVGLGILAALNLASEFVSFSKVIDATPPLRALDRLGRRRP